MDFGANYVDIEAYESCLDGYFTVEQLEEVIRLMRMEKEFAKTIREYDEDIARSQEDKENN